VFSGKVDRDIVRPVQRTGADPRLAAVLGVHPRVVRTEIELRLSNQGALRTVTLTVVRNDPQQELLRGGGGIRRIIVQGGGQPKAQGKHADGDPKHEVEGASTIYRVDFTADRPSNRAKAFKREIRRVLDEAEAAPAKSGAREEDPVGQEDAE
jgi:hypothetical protein